MRPLAALVGSGLALAFVLSPATAQTKKFGFLRGMLPPDEDETFAVAFGDVDGDLDPDILIGNSTSPDRLYLNDGSGAFRDAGTQLPPILDGTAAVAVGDLDGDLDLDVMMVGGPIGRVFLNNGSGGFSYAPTALPFSVLGTSLALGDVDGDGDLDALFGRFGQDRLFLNSGAGVFTDATSQLPMIADQTSAVALADVDGDGDLDAVIGNVGQDRLFVNNGAGVFTDATTQVPLPFAGDDTRAVALGDVDGDGDPDILIGNFLGQSRLFLNNGAGVFSDATAQLPQRFDLTFSMTVGDVDGDLDLDAVIGNGGPLGEQNRLYLNNGLGVFVDATTQLPQALDDSQAIALEDVDGDLDLDLLIGTGSSAARQNRLYLNDGFGVFSDVTAPQPQGLHDTTAVALGDLDGDLDLDALVGHVGQSRLYINQGSGVFSDATSQLPQFFLATQAVDLGDLDGDLDLDLLIGNGGSPIGLNNHVYFNNGSGVFSVAPFLLPAGDTRAVALGDVDGDSDLDAIVADHPFSSAPSTSVLLNNGTGAFSLAPNPLFGSAIAQIDLGNVDGDLDLDAVIGGVLFLNDGLGGFSSAPGQFSGVSGTKDVALGDLDGDGDLDALIGTTGIERLYLNDGSGFFFDFTAQMPQIPDPTEAVALGDIDGDGDLDALIGNLGQNRLYLNLGGFFVDATNQLPLIPDETRAIEIADLDGDGDLDAWIGNKGQDRLLTNLTRQLAWRGLPRVGKPLSLDLYGPSGGMWVLALSLGTANIPIPPLGTLRVDPASIVVVLTGALDPQGRATTTFAVPPNPGLMGIPFYWQAVVGPPVLLTNLETSTLTSL